MRDGRDTSPSIVAELLDVLEWELPESGWTKVARLLSELTGALAAADRDRITALVDAVALTGPVRLDTRLGDVPSVPPPEQVRERVDRLVRDLTTGTGGDAR